MGLYLRDNLKKTISGKLQLCLNSLLHEMTEKQSILLNNIRAKLFAVEYTVLGQTVQIRDH
jgi:hypothetical protein